MTMDILNSGPNRDQPEFERPEWAHDLTPSMTHGEACPIWMWLSDGYVQSAIEKWDYSKDRLRDRYHTKRSKTPPSGSQGASVPDGTGQKMYQ